jgi:16S rRNA (cytosine967-C5)-methyltransferase
LKYHPHLLTACCEALSAIFFEDRYADKCIAFYMKNNKRWGSRDRKFFAETVYDCVRWWSLYWYLLDQKPTPNELKILLPSLWMRGLEHPLTDELIDINFEYLQKRYDECTDPAIKNALPHWLYEHMKSEIGERWDDVLKNLNRPNALVLRVNTQKTNRDDLIHSLFKEDIKAEKLISTSTGIIIEKRVNIFSNKLFKEGHFEVQDGSSQMVAPYLQLQPGLRVIDACAGAGGKSLHIADILKNKGKVISLDIHQWKIDQLKLRARRNNYSNIEMKVIDGQKTIKRLKNTADRLLLDVPCSGLGVLRRNPDTKWKTSKESLSEMQSLQKEILQNYSSMLKPEGLMVYSTCSLLPSENEKQVQHFLDNNNNFSLVKQKTIYPTRDGFDGFFMALIQKN